MNKYQDVKAKKFCCQWTSHLEQVSDLYPQLWAVSVKNWRNLLLRSLYMASGMLVMMIGYKNTRISDLQTELNWFRLSMLHCWSRWVCCIWSCTSPLFVYKFILPYCMKDVWSLLTEMLGSGHQNCRWTSFQTLFCSHFRVCFVTPGLLASTLCLKTPKHWTVCSASWPQDL